MGARCASLRRGSASGSTTTHRSFRRWPEERTGRRGSAGSTSGSTRAGFDPSGPSGISLAEHGSGLVRTDSDPRLAPRLRCPQGRMSSSLILGTTFGSASTQAFGVTYAGVVNGDTAAVLGRSPSITAIAPVSRPWVAAGVACLRAPHLEARCPRRCGNSRGPMYRHRTTEDGSSPQARTTGLALIHRSSLIRFAPRRPALPGRPRRGAIPSARA